MFAFLFVKQQQQAYTIITIVTTGQCQYIYK